MTVKTEPHIGVDFYLQAEYNREKYPNPLFAMTANTHVPIPSVGEHVTFGRVVDDDGEELDKWHYMDSSANYERSEQYEVVTVERHYHNARETNDKGRFVTKRPEITVEIIVEGPPR